MIDPCLKFRSRFLRLTFHLPRGCDQRFGNGIRIGTAAKKIQSFVRSAQRDETVCFGRKCLSCKRRISALYTYPAEQGCGFFQDLCRFFRTAGQAAVVYHERTDLEQERETGVIRLCCSAALFYHLAERAAGELRRCLSVETADLILCHLRLEIHQFIDADVEKYGQLRQKGDIGETLSRFP